MNTKVKKALKTFREAESAWEKFAGVLQNHGGIDPRIEDHSLEALDALAEHLTENFTEAESDEFMDEIGG